MKKIVILFLLLVVTQVNCQAKDYAKSHIKQMQKNQQFHVTNTYYADFSKSKTDTAGIKDPKLVKLGGYEEISEAKLKAKMAKDKVEYDKISKYLASRKENEYHMQAYNQDFYRVYRITERLIRANGLDFINWRVTIDSSNKYNASNIETNSVTVYTGIIDSLNDNDDALALAIAHELAHGVMGHSKQKTRKQATLRRTENLAYIPDFGISYYIGHTIARRNLKESVRNMEYEADIVGAKFVAKAGYNLDKAKETIALMNTMYYIDEGVSSHPDNEKRLKNYDINRTYFMEDEWKKQGLYNIYNSNVLKCEKSSNRNSIIIERGNNGNYQDESYEDINLRYGYKAYLNGEYKDSVKYFQNYLNINKGNYVVYLYTSYAYEALYKQTGNQKCLEKSKEFAQYASQLKPNDKYVKEQISAL